jgi:hypothetical protein
MSGEDLLTKFDELVIYCQARNSMYTALESLLRKAGQLQFMVQILNIVMFWVKMFTNKALFVSR